MKLLIVLGIIVASILKASTTQDILFNKNAVIYVPEYMLEEINNHCEEFKNKMGVDEQAFHNIAKMIFHRLVIIPHEEYAHHRENALAVSQTKKTGRSLPLQCTFIFRCGRTMKNLRNRI